MFQEPDAVAAESPPETKGYVYLFRAESGHYKIGSSKDPSARLQGLDTMPFGLQLVHQMPSNDPRWVERMLHKRFAGERVRGEWFVLEEADVQAILATPRCDRPAWVRRPKAKSRRAPAAKRPDRHMNPVLGLRPAPEERAQLQEMASAERRSLAQMALILLEEAIAARRGRAS